MQEISSLCNSQKYCLCVFLYSVVLPTEISWGPPRMNLFRRYRLQHCQRALRHLGYDVELRIDQFSHFDLHHCSQQQRNLAVRKTIVMFNPCRMLRQDMTAMSVANGCVYDDRSRSSGAAFRDRQCTKSELREPQQASEKRCLELSCSSSAQR